jgi:hypothetical protein
MIGTFIGLTFATFTWELFHEKDYKKSFDEMGHTFFVLFCLWLNVWLWAHPIVTK